MSREIATVRAMYDAFSHGDFDKAAEYIHPEAELRPALEPLEHIGVIRGRAGIRKFLENLGLWESRRVEFEELIDAGGRLLAVERWHVSGREGMELDFRIVDVYTFRDDLIVRVDGYREKEEALEAVGLRE